MRFTTPRAPAWCAVLTVGCMVHHIPPPAELGAPLPPIAAGADGLDVAVGAHSYLQAPIAAHMRASRAFVLGDGPLAIELGGNASTGWAGLNPALHWAPDPKDGSAWAYGARLGVVFGTGDILRVDPYLDPYLGGSIHGQLSRFWANGGAFTVALGGGYTGHIRCLGGCGYTVPKTGYEDCVDTIKEECPDPTSHSFDPYLGPSLHLRADLPVGSDGHAWMIALGAQPAIFYGDAAPVFTLSTGIHHHDPNPRW